MQGSVLRLCLKIERLNLSQPIVALKLSDGIVRETSHTLRLPSKPGTAVALAAAGEQSDVAAGYRPPSHILVPEQMTAVAMESESELRRSGGFELIFPVAGTANKYLKFFDGPRPLERMLANSATANRDKAAPGGSGAWRSGPEKRSSRRWGALKCRKGHDTKDHRRASSVSPVRDLQIV